MSLVQGQILLKIGFLCALQAVLGSQGIVVNCTAVIYFLTVDSLLLIRIAPSIKPKQFSRGAPFACMTSAYSCNNVDSKNRHSIESFCGYDC